MIHLDDPYWRKILAIAVGAPLVLAVLALVTLPMMAESAGPSPSRPPPDALHVEKPASYLGDSGGASWWLVCNVTNSGHANTTNLTASISGVTLKPIDDPPRSTSGRLALGGSDQVSIDVYLANGLDIQVSSTAIAPMGALSLDLAAPNGKTWSGSGQGTSKALTLKLPDLVEGGYGIYTATVRHTAGVRLITYSMTASETHLPPDLNETWPSLAPGEMHAFEWYVEAAAPGKAPNATVVVSVDAADLGGSAVRVSYVAGQASPTVKGPSSARVVPLTAGELLGFSAIGVITISVASGALRVRGGRPTSQDRGRREVSLHRVAWLAALVLIPFHGLVQIVSGHLDDVGAISLGVAAFVGIVGLVWLNAFQRPRVLAMAWPRWLAVKVMWVAGICAVVAAHILLYGRHFVG